MTPMKWTWPATATMEGTSRDPAARRRADAQSTPWEVKLLASLGGQLGMQTSSGRDWHPQQGPREQWPYSALPALPSARP